MARAEGVCRRLVIGGREVNYSLRRSRRRTVGLSVGRNGLVVGVPLAASVSEIEGVIARHAAWVIERLDRWVPAPAPWLPADGASLPWLGARLVLRVRAHGASGWSADGWEFVLVGGSADLREQLVAALRERVYGHFTARLAHFAPRLALEAPPLVLSAARGRWGSCNAQGVVRLNWRLGFLTPPLIDYVVIHELAHLREMNHSPRFWAVVEALCPDWRALRKELRRLAPTIPNL